MNLKTTKLINFFHNHIDDIELSLDMLKEEEFALFFNKFVNSNANNYHLILQDKRLVNPVLSSNGNSISNFLIYLKCVLNNSNVENYEMAYSLKSKHFCLISVDDFDDFHYVKLQDFIYSKSFFKFQKSRLEYYTEEELNKLYSIIDFIFNFPISYYEIN